MIKREWYMKKIRPFFDQEVIKVLTGIRRSGKSVMLRLIQEELSLRGVSEEQMMTINFENMSFAHLCYAEKLHEEMERRISEIQGKAYLFFDEIQEVSDWERCINSLRVKFDCDIYNSVVLKDIVKRNNIRDVELLERIILYVMANVGTTLIFC